MKSKNNIWNIKDFQECMTGKKFKIHTLIKCFCRCIRWSWQRIKRGYADCDWWNMDSYLQRLIPEMLQELRTNRHGSPAYLGEIYTDEYGIQTNDTCHAEWDRILDQMIFLWHESSEDTCSQKNKWEEEYFLAFDNFTKEYETFGEKLQTEDEKGNLGRIHFMDELPEYEEISKKYREENNRLEKYRERCKDEAMDLMKTHFFALYD